MFLAFVILLHKIRDSDGRVDNKKCVARTLFPPSIDVENMSNLMTLIGSVVGQEYNEE